jgi:hypothetical protein
MLRIPRCLKDDVLHADQAQLPIRLGLVHQRLGEERIKHRVADELAMDKVNAHGPFSRFVNAVQELGIAHYLCGLALVQCDGNRSVSEIGGQTE